MMYNAVFYLLGNAIQPSPDTYYGDPGIYTFCAKTSWTSYFNVSLRPLL
jgi:hypothetical protein